MLAQITDNRNFHYEGICYINEYWYRFLYSTTYCKKYRKKTHHHVLNISLFPTLEAYLAFYQRQCNVLSFSTSDYSAPLTVPRAEQTLKK